jgi:methylthioribose-1-phosphate isomerase
MVYLGWDRKMNVDQIPYRTIGIADDGWRVRIIDQTRLPHDLVILELENIAEMAEAIKLMRVRGAPLIGASAAYGIALAMNESPSNKSLDAAVETLTRTRPTAVNLHWALMDMRDRLAILTPEHRVEAAYRRAAEICDEDTEINRRIGEHALPLIKSAANEKRLGESVNILTHCNAGWLATVDWGTATSPIYQAHEAGISIHVWVDETRPRNQGASLTAWELGQHGVPHTVIVDNAGGHLMQKGEIDLCITGTDRTTATGDVANKIGTYLKALAANDNGVPFYVALPSSTIDWNLQDGLTEIPIEERAESEVTEITGRTASGAVETIRIVADGSRATNPAFDVTPARLVTGLVTERGIAEASREGLLKLFPERR